MERSLLVGVAALLLGAPWTHGQVFGPELRVNSKTDGQQYSAAIAGNAEGFLVVWSGSPDGSYDGVFGRRLTPDGAPVGEDFQVNTVDFLHQFSASVAVGPEGPFAVAWATGELSANGETDIAVRFFDDSGPLGPEIAVNSFGDGRQSAPSIAAATGGFVVVWQSPVYGYPGSEIRGQRLDSSGTLLGGEFQVNGETAGRQKYPSVAVGSDGAFVVVWHGYHEGAYDFEIFGRRFASNGSALGDDFLVNTYTSGTQFFPVVRTRRNDDFLVAWDSFGSPGDDQSNGSVQARLFDSDGLPRHDQIQVNTTTASGQLTPAVASTDGGFVVAWADGASFETGLDGDGYGIVARALGADGMPIGDERLVNVYTPHAQRLPAIARSGRDFVIVWQGTGDDLDRNVFSRRFTPPLIFADGTESGDLSSWSTDDPLEP